MDHPPQSWVGLQLHQAPGYWLVQFFPQPSSEAFFFISASSSPTVSPSGCTWFLLLSLSWLFLQVICLAFLQTFATQGSHALKDCFVLVLSVFGMHFGPTSTAVMQFHLGRTAITQGLALYSWSAPSIQEALFLVQLPLCHAALGTIAYTVAWGVPFGRPRSKGVHLRAPLPRQGKDSFGGAAFVNIK